MKAYIVTSATLYGQIIYKFNDELKFTCIDIQGNIDEPQRQWLLQYLPPDEASFLRMIEKSKKLKALEVPLDLSFEAFWLAYNYKVDKKAAEKAWKGTPEANKVIALQCIRVYDKWLKEKGHAKLYPSTFLNQERYNDDFSK